AGIPEVGSLVSRGGAPKDVDRVPAPRLMPLQNGVDPYGRLHAVAERGAVMRNRGVLHDESRGVAAAWRTRRWIARTPAIGNLKREVSAPRRYSELFCLDEATALAAGHRPCAECQRKRYEEFRASWTAAREGVRSGRPPGADDVDRVLHAERVDRGGEKRT